jgi:branched-chain amino acid transport system ATP-binding protein
MMARVLSHPALWVAVVLSALTFIWQALGAPVGLVTQIAIYALYGAGVNMLVGYTGLVPFGASVFFGCASYVAAMSVLDGHVNDVTALVVSVVVAAGLALVIGAVILRRKGLYFSLLTLACSQIAFEVAFKWTAVTGGENGLQGVARPTFPSALSYHWFTVATVVLGFWALWRIAHSPFGRTLQAVRDNEQRAASLGLNVYLVRLGAFTLMAVVLGYSGALLTLLLQGAYANNLSWQHAGDALLMTVLGGVHHFLGPLWGAIAFIVAENRLSALSENWWLIFAPVLIAFALLSPEGIQGLVQRLLRRERWTLTRNTTPARPAHIVPYESAAAALDPVKPVLEVLKLSKSFGSLVTAREIDLEVHPFVLHSIIGPNGAGKTTFYNMLTGVLPPSSGRIVFEGRDITRLPIYARARLGISRSFQILSVFPNLSVFENVRIAVQAQQIGAGGLLADAHRIGTVNERTWSLLDAVGLADRAADATVNLSHGAKRLLEIAVTLAIEAKLLLLDEPLAGLAEADRVIVADLIKRLSRNAADTRTCAAR